MAEKKEKGKDKSKQSSPAADGNAMSIAAHPRAARRVAQAKGWGGLLGFAVGGYLSLRTHTPAEAGFRALIAGIACYAVVWGGAVFLWRHLVVAELRARQHALLHTELERIGGQPRQPPSSSTAA